MKDYFGYSRKVCVVTGAASAVGIATVDMLLDFGAEVYALDVVQVKAPVKKYIKTNMSDYKSIDAAFADIPAKIDKYFGIASVSGVKTDFSTTIRTNFLGNKYATDKYLTTRIVDGGSIVFLGSLAGRGFVETRDEYKDVCEAKTIEEAEEKLAEIAERVSKLDYGNTEGSKGYYLSKRMISYYSNQIMSGFAFRDIRVNVICQGYTQTQLTEEWESLNPMIRSNNNATRFADPGEMAGPLVFANSDMASYMSGQHIYI